jgi:hypothetical protein
LPQFKSGCLLTKALANRGIVETCVLAGEKKAAYPAGDFGFIHQRPNEGTKDTPCVKLRQSRWFSQ